MIPTELDQLVHHMEWADAVVWQAALATPGARADERVRELLHHVHAVQWAYLQLLRSEDVEVPDVADFDSLDAVRPWGRRGHVELATFVEELEPAELDRKIVFPWAERLAERLHEVHPTDVRQSLLQVTSHSTYHRGQINTRLRQVGGEPPLVDFVAWVWMGCPEAPWGD